MSYYDQERTYVWLVTWYDKNNNKQSRTFTNKRKALALMAKLEADQFEKDYWGINLEKYYG